MAFFARAQIMKLSHPENIHGIEFSINGYSGATHYHTPLEIKLKNLTTEPKTVQIDPGQIMVSKIESKQNFVITKQEIITLAPKQSRTLNLHAMCIERHDGAPNEYTGYDPGPMADSNLRMLAEKIAAEGLYSYEAQTAVWAMVGDYSLNQIVGYDTTTVRNLAQMAADAQGVELPPPPDPDDYSRSYYTPSYTYKLRMGGEFSYSLWDESEIIIAMFDVDGIVVRELYKDQNCPAGKHNMEFDFDATEYTNDKYFVRLIEDGEIMLELEVDIPERPGRG
jgi:hypothetical protein